MLEWANPFIFLLFIPLALGLLWRWFSAPAAIAFSSTKLVADAPASRWLAPHHLSLALEAIACLLFITALARPQFAIEVVPVTREGTDIVMVLDYSNSMDAFDPAPELMENEILKQIDDGKLVDRLGVAREQIARFVKRRSGDRIGLVIFGHRAFIACPPTLDHDYLVAQVDQLNNSLLGMHERGTSIASGLASGINVLDDLSDKRRSIVLITDGENTINDPAFTPREAAELAKDRDITVHTIGIGSPKPYIPKHLRGSMRNESFDTAALRDIAATADGRFFRPMDNKGFEAVMDTIDALETTSRVHPAIVYRRDLFPFVLLAAAIALLLAFILPNTLLLRIP